MAGEPDPIFVELVGASGLGQRIGNIMSVISEMDQFGAQLKARMDGEELLDVQEVPARDAEARAQDLRPLLRQEDDQPTRLGQGEPPARPPCHLLPTL